MAFLNSNGVMVTAHEDVKVYCKMIMHLAKHHHLSLLHHLQSLITTVKGSQLFCFVISMLAESLHCD